MKIAYRIIHIKQITTVDVSECMAELLISVGIEINYAA